MVGMNLMAVMLPPSREVAEHRNCIIRELSTGLYCMVHLSIPRAAADQDLAEFAAGSATEAERRATFWQLRERIQVVKIVKDSPVESEKAENVNRDVKILVTRGKHQHPNMMKLIEADQTSLFKTWYTMPLCSRNSLRRVLGMPWSPEGNSPPVAFGWHICLQIAKAFLYLHHGILEDGTIIPSWPLMAHGDTHDDNFLFVPVNECTGDKCKYPNLLLADFDQAFYVPADCSSAERSNLLRRKTRDIEALVCKIECIARRINDQALRRCFVAVGNIPQAEAGALRNERAYGMLVWFVKFAERRRDELYQPLPVDFEALFQRPHVTDDELGRVFPILTANSSHDKPASTVVRYLV